MRRTIPVATALLTFACVASEPAGASDVPGEAGGLLQGDAADPGPGHDAPDVDADPCPQGRIAIDFPCSATFVCRDSTRFVRFRTVTCTDLGYDPRCCMGGGCETDGEGQCGTGELCVLGVGRGNDECVKADCGGPAATACAEGDFCEMATGSCDPVTARGACVGVPKEEQWCREPYGYPHHPGGWACGCDGKSYRNDCERRKAATSKAGDGPCCDPSKVGFARENPAGHTGWVACIAAAGGSPFYDVLPQLLLVAPGLDCPDSPPVSDSPVCAPGDRWCRSELALEPGSAMVTDASWQEVCRVAGFPFVARVVGTGGAACVGVDCAEAPRCGEPCGAPCGCCACANGKARCDGPYLLVCKSGCWDLAKCSGGGACIEGGPSGATCGRSCEEIEADWERFAEGDFAKCGDDAGCRILAGHCEVGLGGCFVATGYGIGQWDLDILASEWVAAGCGGGGVCKCAPPPDAAYCIDGRCAAAVEE